MRYIVFVKLDGDWWWKQEPNTYTEKEINEMIKCGEFKYKKGGFRYYKIRTLKHGLIQMKCVEATINYEEE